MHPRRIGRTHDLRGLRKDGSLVPIEIVINTFAAEGSECLVLSVINVSERKAFEHKLRSQAELLDLAHETIMILDLEGRIKYWNHGAEEMYGFTAGQAVKQKAHGLLQCEFPSPIDQIKQQLLATMRAFPSGGRLLVSVSGAVAGALERALEKGIANPGMDDYISKPYTIGQLRHKLASWL